MLAGCGGAAKPKPVPDVRGERLDVAEARLDARGLQWEEIGGGVFGVAVRSQWYVDDQIPRPGKKATTVRLVVPLAGRPNAAVEEPAAGASAP